MKRTTILALFCLLIFACSAADRAAGSRSSPNLPAAQVENQTAAPSSAAAEKASGSAAQDARQDGQKSSLDQAERAKNAPTASERKIIRNATIALESNQTEEAGRKIAQIAEQKGGFVVTSDTKAATGAGGATTSATVKLVVRVPAAKFDETVGEIRAAGQRVVSETVAGQDVTEEFIDLEARINTKKALENQFLEIMKRSAGVTEALQVQRELATVRGEIESLEGRRKFLESQTALSTVTVTVAAPAVFVASSKGFFYQVGRAFSDGVEAALAVVLFLITAFLALLPVIIVLGVPLWLLWRYVRKRIQRAKLAQKLAQEEKNEPLGDAI